MTKRKRTIHLHRDDEGSLTYCGINLDERDLYFTFDRRQATCRRCRKESDPGPMLDQGHAARELDRLRQQNLLKLGVEVTMKGKERSMFNRVHKHGPIGLVPLSVMMNMKLSDAKRIANKLFNQGLFRKNGRGFVAYCGSLSDK